MSWKPCWRHDPDPKKAKEIEIKIVAPAAQAQGRPAVHGAWASGWKQLKERHEQGLLNSVEFLKELLELAKDVVEAEKAVAAEEDQDRGKAALTELFNEVKNDETPMMVERIVADIDEIVRLVRFPGWQHTGRRARGEEGAAQDAASNTNSTRTRSSSTGPTATSASTTDSPGPAAPRPGTKTVSEG